MMQHYMKIGSGGLLFYPTRVLLTLFEFHHQGLTTSPPSAAFSEDLAMR